MEEAHSQWKPTGSGDFPAGVEVGGGTQIVEESQILIDRFDSHRSRSCRAVQVHRISFDLDDPGVELVDPTHTLDQRRLPGTVVAEYRQHLTGVDGDIDIIEG
jgi:hypothetical protein